MTTSNRIRITFLLLIVTAGMCLAEDKPSEPSVSATSTFDTVFKETLTETDFFVCDSDISVIVAKNISGKDTEEESFYLKASKRGKNGSQVLADLNRSLETFKKKAVEDCQNKNSSHNCIQKHLVNNQAKYNEFDYAAKKTFLESIQKSCNEIKTTCKSAKATPANCFIVKLDENQIPPKAEATPVDPKAAKK